MDDGEPQSQPIAHFPKKCDLRVANAILRRSQLPMTEDNDRGTAGLARDTLLSLDRAPSLT